jgi:hypothetical protein
MRSFYLRICVSAIANWPYFWNISINLQSFLIFLYANSLYARQIFWFLSIAYNKVHLYRSMARFSIQQYEKLALGLMTNPLVTSIFQYFLVCGTINHLKMTICDTLCNTTLIKKQYIQKLVAHLESFGGTLECCGTPVGSHCKFSKCL